MSFRDRETHPDAQDYWEEVGDGVGVCGSEAEETSESPDFRVECVQEIRFYGKGFWDSIVAVDFDSGDDEFGFLFCEKLPGFGGVFGEVDDKKVAGDA